MSQCPEVSPRSGKQCVRVGGTHDHHADSRSYDVWCHRWYTDNDWTDRQNARGTGT